jgi:enterochelin esterase-like enzyme
MKQAMTKALSIALCLAFVMGCTAAPASETADAQSVEEDKQQENPTADEPAADAAFAFTKAILDVPDAYTTAGSQQGTLTKFYYMTRDYNGDNHEELKYATVYTPYHYDSTKQYNIMYLMHGHGGNADDWLGSPEEPVDVKYCIDHLIEDGRIEPMIVVALTYYDENTEEDTSNYDMDIIKTFSSEFINDVMPQVESTYSTYAASVDEQGLTASRDHRIFGGFSMGAVTTWYQFISAMKYVRYYYPASGSFYWSREIDRTDDAAAGNLIANSLTAQGYTKDDFYVYMTTGSEDFGKGIVEAQINSLLMHPDLFIFGGPDEPGVNCTYGISDGEDHNFHGRLRDIYTLLPVFSKKMNS